MIHWIQAARLRTLPLSLSGIIMGGFIANSVGAFDKVIFGLTVLLTICFQVISNFANDYGDFVKGTDDNRVGEERMMASGKISPKEMKIALWVLAIFSLFVTVFLLYYSFVPDYINEFYVFMGLGVISVLAALGYTLGKKPYGYLGLGDFFVFIFFGILAVCGSVFIYTKFFDYYTLLPAASIGFFSMAVLNLNNMRDAENDLRYGKKTLAVRLGTQKAMIYELVLLYLPFATGLIYVLEKYPQQYLTMVFLILLLPMMAIRRKIMEVQNPSEYDAFLKQVALLCLGFSILWGMGINNFFR